MQFVSGRVLLWRPGGVVKSHSRETNPVQWLEVSEFAESAYSAVSVVFASENWHRI